LDSPLTANWKVNAFAPASADASNTALTVRRFDDTLEEGVGFILETPLGISNVVLDFKARPYSLQTGVKSVVPKLYARGIPDNTAVTAWSTGTRLTPVDYTNNVFYHYDQRIVSMATLGMTAGQATQFELTRVGSDATDTVVGDWALLSIGVSFT
jgi:hypothetical protein